MSVTLENLAQSNPSQWEVKRGELTVSPVSTKEPGFFGRIVDWFRGSSKSCQVYKVLAGQISEDTCRSYDHMKAMMDLKEKVKIHSAEQKTSKVVRFFKGNFIERASHQVSNAIDEKLSTFICEKASYNGTDKNKFVELIYEDLCREDVDDQHIEEFKNRLNEFYGENAETKLNEFVELKYPMALLIREQKHLKKREDGTYEPLQDVPLD